jgi:hypothetical protein
MIALATGMQVTGTFAQVDRILATQWLRRRTSEAETLRVRR